MRVRVCFGDGMPVSGSRVRLRARLLAEDPPWARDDRWRNGIWDVRKAGRWGGTHWGGRMDLAMATTDANGVAELAWQPWHEPVIVRADGPGHVASQLELPGVDPGGKPIEMRVGRGATIAGTVSSMNRWRELLVDSMGNAVEWNFDRLQPCVVLRNCADGLQQGDCEGRSFPISADGTFACQDVPPGRWQILFEYDRPEVGGIGASVPVLPRSLAEVVAMPGKHHEVAFDLSQTLPGVLRGRILLDGDVHAATSLGVHSFGRDHLGHPQHILWQTFYRDVLYADGTYKVGSFAGDVELEADIDGKHYRLFERVPLAPGENKEIDLRFRHLVARIQLVREDGTPVGNRVVRTGTDEQRNWADEDGWCTLDPVRELHFDVELLPPGIERSQMARWMLNDPLLRTEKLGHLDLDVEKPKSEHRLVVRGP